MPVAIDNAIVNARTRQSTVTTAPFSPTRGRPAVFTASSARIPTVPRSSPSVPPASDSMRLSVEQLPDDAPTSRADGRTHGDFPFTRRCPREQQVRDIRARDEQHEADGAQQQPERWADVRDERVPERLSAEERVAPQRVRELAVVLGSRKLQSRLRLLERHTALEPPGGLEVMALVSASAGFNWNGSHTSGAGPKSDTSNAGADDPDDDVRIASDRDGLPDDARVRSETPRPQGVAQDDRAIAARTVFVSA